MKNGWTGGQYSLFRGLLGLYLLAHFLSRIGRPESPAASVAAPVSGEPFLPHIPSIFSVWDVPVPAGALFALAAGLCLPLLLGFHDRLAAGLLLILWMCLHGLNPFYTRDPSPLIGLVLAVHLLLPAAPYLSVAARGRPDPAGGWRFRPRVLALAWIMLSMLYAGTGLSRLLGAPALEWSSVPGGGVPAAILTLSGWASVGLEILFAPLALIPRARRWVWTLMLLRHLTLLSLGAVEPGWGLLIAHLFLFDPAWVPAAGPAGLEMIFYDGRCGLCHRSVRFILAEDEAGRAFRFAPMQGEACADAVPEEARATLPDSLILRTGEGDLLTRSRCLRRVLARLGGIWRVAEIIGRVVPAPLADALYDGIARVRHRLFRRPPDLCPIMPERLRARFDP